MKHCKCGKIIKEHQEVCEDCYNRELYQEQEEHEAELREEM